MNRTLIYSLLIAVIVLTGVAHKLTVKVYSYQEEQVYHEGDKQFYKSFIEDVAGR